MKSTLTILALTLSLTSLSIFADVKDSTITNESTNENATIANWGDENNNAIGSVISK